MGHLILKSRLIVLVVSMLTVLSSAAKQYPTITGKLQTVGATTVTIGTSSATNSIAVLPAAGSADYHVLNTIALKYDFNTDTFFQQDAAVRVKLTVNRWNAAGSAMTPRTEYLRISVSNKLGENTLYQDMLKLTDGYKVETTVDSIWVNGAAVGTLPRYVSVESEIGFDRYYDFSSSVATEVSFSDYALIDKDCDLVDDEVQLIWSPNILAEEYQLEWIYVNNYNAAGTGTYPASAFRIDFRHSASRITIKDNSYKLSLLYDKGFLAFRVRAVGRDYLNPSAYIYGPWSSGSSDVITLSSFTSGKDLHSISVPHENSKNWQYSTTFAEEGKKKEVISYFDGSLYNRQSVTKTNSNDVVIVGETIYDFQGRPAVQVLPVPVVSLCDGSISTSSIKYHPKFNVDTTDSPYSGPNFDLDVSACIASASPMDTVSGASRYYSGNNLLMGQQQSFVPHARRYPFSQVEYTPDNTGRIRSQSGVGKNYQLGSGRETKYLYGQPNQIQVDRLFGPEAGDASHYKKNVVIDANGQTSVTYLNQEGKTIATALAGITPADGSGTRVDSLSYAAANQKEFGIDLFNKDANGNSQLNKVPASADRIEFCSQLLVSYASNYAFRYKLQIDTLADLCLKENLCINCIYNLDIEVRDECGYDLAATAAGRMLNGVSGKVDTTGGMPSFVMTCSGESLHKDSALFEMILYPGVYTVSKVLSVNKDARDFYVKNYMDTANNTCVKPLSYFQAAELAKIDTMDCYNSCSACVAALGGKDDFVSSGRGTEVQYEYLLEQCTEPCRQQTLCKITYDMMLSDVSIGGQYGKYNPATFYAGDQPLSVFNTANTLNANLAAGNSNWKHPRMRVNGTLHGLYLSSEGERTKVSLTRDTVNFIPPVDDTTLVYTDASTLEKYTYPENLRNLSDFIPVWSAGFARSLVIYHPEYAYYVSCMDHGVVFPADTLSSDELDSLLFVTETFAQAITNGFINGATYNSSMVPALSKVTHIWNSTSGLYDPFFTNTDFLYTDTANATTGSKTTIPMLNGFQALRVDPATEMNNKITNFQLKGTYYNMAEVAAMLARCGTNYGASPTAPCLAFGTDYYPSPTSQQAIWNDSIRNLEWKFFKNFYYSEKQKIQFRRMEFYARHLDDANSNYYGGSNACFGKSDYNPVLSKILIPAPGGFGWIGFPYSVFHDLSQPCSYYTWKEYAGVIRRFYDPVNSGVSTGNVAQQIYEQTGQCPRAFQLQNFLNGMAQTHRLAKAQYTSLDSVYEFTPDLYLAINGGLNPSAYIPYQYSVTSTSGSIIAVSFKNPATGATQCTLTINAAGTAIINLDSIVGITQLVYNPAGTGPGAYKAVAAYINGGTMHSANITGNSCINIKDCSFETECMPSQFLVDMQSLISMLQAEGKLQTSLTPLSLAHDTAYNQFLTPAIKSALGSPNAHMMYKVQGGGSLSFYDSLNPSIKIRINVLSVSPSTALGNITAFVNAKTNGNNLASMQGVDSTGAVILDMFMKFDKLTATDTVGIATGNCSLPDPVECQQKEHQVRKDLEKAVKAILIQKPFNSNISLIAFSPLLYTYALDSALTTAYTSDTNAVTNYDTLIISNVDTVSLCRIMLTHKRSDGSQLNFPDIVNVKKLQGIGNADIAGNYYDFMAIATYTTGAGLVNDTIYGTSCLPIKNCSSCLPEEEEMLDGHYTDYEAQDFFYFPQPHPVVCDTAEVRFSIQSIVNAYNLSSFSAMHSHTLSAVLTATQVEQFCYCYKTYNDYLRIYLPLDSNSVDSISMQALPLPQSILNFGGCADGSHCMDLYVQYIKTLKDFVTIFHGKANIIPLTELYTPAEFTEKYCGCAPKFINNMYAVMAGSVPPTTPYITNMDSACSRPLCTSPVDSTFSVPTYTVYTNPCVQQMKNLAAINAANAYNQYIDSMTTDLADRYNRHCLAATERLNYNYTDKEYHFTLYYYDQAGNLIKTVPPEGVEPLDVKDAGDALEQCINYDRTNAVQNVFTTHRMPTKYVYNSLNQLTYQTMPDHDNMDICEGNNPHGLDTGLVITSVKFTDASRGYLTGYVQVNSRLARGYAYVTNDGGNNWKRLNGTVSGNIQKVQFDGNDNYGFAISDNGMILKTVDGGNSWDLVTSLYQPLSGTRYTGKLTAMHMSAGSGVVAGINDGTNPFMYYTTDSAKTFAPCTITGSSAGDTITSIAVIKGVSTFTVIASARNGLFGKLFSSNDAINWSQITSFTANHHKKAQYVSPTLAIVTGEDGNLYKTTSSLTYQQMPTGVYGNIIDVHFKNETYGIALIDSVAGKAKIWKTANGGLSWEPFSAPGEYYNSFKYYDSTKIMAYGDNGALARIVMTIPGFGIVKPAKPNSDDFSTGDAITMADGSLLGIVASDASHKIHLSYNLQQSSPVWISAKADTLTSPIPATHAYFKKVLASVSSTSPSSHILKALLLSTTGRLYSLTKSSVSSAIVCDTVNISGSLSGKFFNDITCNSQTGTVDFYAYDTVSKALHRINFSGLTASGTVIGNSSSITGSVRSIDISNTTHEIILVGRDGYINYGADVSLSTVNWTEQTTTLKPCALNGVTMYGTTAACVGNDGSLWKINGSYNSWFLRNTSTAADLNALSVLNSSGGRGYLVGDAGKMIYMTSANSFNPVLIHLAPVISSDYTDVFVESGNKLYATASDGKVVAMSNFSSMTPLLAAPASNVPANAVTIRSGGEVVVVGNNAGIYKYGGLSNLKINALYPTPLIGASFSDANNGYLIDTMNVIRRTADGGNTWSVVLPQTGNYRLTGLTAVKSNQCVLVGHNAYAAVVNNNAISSITVPSLSGTVNFLDVDFTPDSKYGIVSGSNTNALSLVPNGSNFTMTSLGTAGSAADLRAVHVFPNHSFMAAGSGGKIYYYKGGTFYSQTSFIPPAGLTASDVVFNDIYFRDDYTGYVVGRNAAAYKVLLNDSLAAAGTSANSLVWTSLCSDALNPGYTTNAQLSKMSFNAIAFAGPSKPMIAGSDSNVVINSVFTPGRYARLLKEESNYYSTRFWYDKLGRMVLSQNTKQYNKYNPDTVGVRQAYSYTLYDALGRITEVGEKFENYGSGHKKFRTIFGSMVNNFYNLNTIDDVKLNTWITGNGTRREVTHTYYDEQNILIPGVGTQENLRKRVASVSYEDVYDGVDSTYQHATHYTYDIHGNVNSLWQETPSLLSIAQRFKRTDYDYDLISGKVNNVHYQDSAADGFHHHYEYDADNRITQVYTSADNGARWTGEQDDPLWTLDAKYFYYDHGPLARVEYGKAHVQGTDYAYTLQGWIKGVNSTILSPGKDMGSDNMADSVNADFAKDVFSYSLNYYKGDYDAINYMRWNTASSRFEAYHHTSDLMDERNDLFNGNITAMATTISRPDTVASQLITGQTATALSSAYRYDQLNRIARSVAFTNLDLSNNNWKNDNSSTAKLYRNAFKYDANGNITEQVKYDSLGVIMDSLVYRYEKINGKLKRNRLYHVNEKAGSTAMSYDIEDQLAFAAGLDSINVYNNYRYDEIGNLVHDSIEGIDSIKWTVYGKIKAIKRFSGSAKDNLYFDYDASGNRTAKHVYTPAGVWKHSTYYVRDAQGNVMSTYSHKAAGMSMSYKLQEQHLYGSSRLGMAYPNLEMIGGLTNLDTMKTWFGNKNYELSNHLGNVLTTISDRKIQQDTNSNTQVDGYVADISTSTDYYAFGQVLPGRSFSLPQPSCSCELYKDAVHNYTATYSADLSDVSQLTTFINTAMGTSLSDGDCLDSLRKCSLLHEGLLFSGDGTYADVGDNPQYYTGTADFTAEAWFNTQTVSDQTIISTAIDVPGGLNGFQLLLYNSNRVLIAAYDGVGYQEIITDNSISLNEWHHVVAQRIGNDANNYKIYVDGVEMTVQPMPTNISFGTGDISNYALSTLKIGCRESSIRPFDGYIKEARLYKRILSGGEVVYNYNNGCMPMLQDTTSLLLHAILNETAGTTSWTEQSNYAESCGIYGGGADFSKHEMTGCVTCGRTFAYRYGFNGKEKDDETYGNGNEYDFGDRIYDPRISRFLSIDSRTAEFAYWSPYLYAGNSPLRYTDVNGEGPGDAVVTKMSSSVVNGKTVINVEASVTVKIKILNLSSHNIDMDKLGYKVEQAAEKQFGGASTSNHQLSLMYDGGLYKKPVNAEVNAKIDYNVEYEVINSLDDKSIGKYDNVMILVDEIHDQGKLNPGGLTNRIGGNVALVEANAIDPNRAEGSYGPMVSTALHELGHMVGLDEAYVFDQVKGIMTQNSSGNIMGAGQPASSSIDNTQRGDIAHTALQTEGSVCRNGKAAAYGKTDAKTDAKAFLKKEGKSYKGK